MPIKRANCGSLGWMTASNLVKLMTLEIHKNCVAQETGPSSRSTYFGWLARSPLVRISIGQFRSSRWHKSIMVGRSFRNKRREEKTTTGSLPLCNCHRRCAERHPSLFIWWWRVIVVEVKTYAYLFIRLLPLGYSRKALHDQLKPMMGITTDLGDIFKFWFTPISMRSEAMSWFAQIPHLMNEWTAKKTTSWKYLVSYLP